MRKALAACGVVAIALAGVIGCGASESNYGPFRVQLHYAFADIRMMDGTVKTVCVASWGDCSNKDTIFITDTDGVSWMAHINNVILRSETNTWERETP